MSFFKDLVSRIFPSLADGATFEKRMSSADSPTQKPVTIAEIAGHQPEWIVVGLGNPGKKYAATRHNVGYMAIDDILANHGEILRPVAGVPASAALVSVGSTPVLIARSSTFMNLSGEPIAVLASKLDIPAERIIVAHDELDLPAQKVRLKKGGNENGHNGLKSLTEQLGTRDYLRVRMGIGRPQKDHRGNAQPIVDWVLGPVDTTEGFDEFIERAVFAVEALISEGLNRAQNSVHAN